MAARRLLIVMLVLLGLSTLAAALVPQHAVRRTTSVSTTATQPTQTATAPVPPAGRSLSATITVGGKPITLGGQPICPKGGKCEAPIQVGDQLSLAVFSKPLQEELEIPDFGVLGVASPVAPARFELLFDRPRTVGIVFTTPRRVAARIDVLSAKAAAKELARYRSRR